MSDAPPPSPSDLALADRTALVHYKAKTFVEEAAQGADRAFGLAEVALEDALFYQDLARRLMRNKYSKLHEEILDTSPEGERRFRMANAAFDRATKSAGMCMDLATKALWFKQVVEDHGGEAGAAKDAQAEVTTPDGPLQRLAELNATITEVDKKRGRGTRRWQEKMRERVVKGAEKVLDEAKSDGVT